MIIVKQYMTNNPYYKVNVSGSDSRYNLFQKRGPQGLMLHSVGCAQPNAQVFINTFNRESYDAACVHGFIDGNSGTVYQTMPWNFRAPHCGGDANNTHIGVEMCEPAGIRYGGGATFTVTDRTEAVAVVKRTYAAAVELFASLCVQYNLNPMTAIISHREGSIKGVASAHGDPEHLWNGLGLGYTMDTFRSAVKAAMASTGGTGSAQPTVPSTPTSVPIYRVRKTWGDSAGQIGAYASLDGAKSVADANPGYYVFDGSGRAVYPEKTENVKPVGTASYYRFTAGKEGAAVYADTARTVEIGSLNPGEQCFGFEVGSAEMLVWYALDNGSGYKAGYVRRSSGKVG